MTIIAAMCLFALTMSITPGPVNIITLSSGVNYGFVRTIPFITGSVVAFNLLLVFIGLGMGQVLAQNASFMMLLNIGGPLFICYMGYRIATSSGKINLQENDQLKFKEGAILQLLNPKAWIACVVGVSSFGVVGAYDKLILFVSLYFVVQYFSVSIWGYAGSKISVFLSNEQRFKIFNLVMGGGLILVALYLLFIQTKGG